jgi:beta-lactam-binding protein with PASTA domain
VQPLKARVLYKPLSARQRPGVVLQQYPKSGTLSSYDAVTLFLGKPLHGVVPRVTGLPVEQARTKLEDAKLLPRVVKEVPQPKRLGRVLFQAPKGGVAASPGMEIRLIVAGSAD